MKLDSIGNYCMYLRKSRKDIEAEKHGEGETLKRHFEMLMSLATRLKIIIREDAIYKEIVSGDTIASRPVMQQLLADIEIGKWDGVLVVEVERLARGDTIDQGIVAQTFKYSNTKIITPMKIYNPNDEGDEEYFEFGLFMARREYKKIRQRMENGRVASVQEGKFVGNVAPYGFSRKKIKGDKGFMLVENPEEADTLRLIFNLYANQNYSYNRIADHLNSLGIKPRHAKNWNVATIRDILHNETYRGILHWGARKNVKVIKKGIVTMTRPRNKGDYTVSQGLHTPLISEELWEKALERHRVTAPKCPHPTSLQNPLAGLVICGKCGAKMQRRPYKDRQPSLICTNRKCDNISSDLEIIERKIIEALKEWLGDVAINFEKVEEENTLQVKALERALAKTKVELEKAELKLKRVCECYEEKTYTREVFLQRSQAVSEEIRKLRENVENQERELEETRVKYKSEEDFVPQAQYVLDTYYMTNDPEERNRMLKNILEKAVYTKTERAIRKDSDPTNFTIELYPKISKIDS